MKKAYVTGLLLIIGLLLLTGCEYSRTYAEEDDGERDIFASFLEDQDLVIVSREGKTDEYVLSREILLTPPYQHLWALQDVTPEDYIGERIEVHQFVVTNHPLDHLDGNEKEQTLLWLMESNGRIIGGYGFPDFDEPHYGNVYSLEGKTLEEVTGLSFQEWRQAWENRYQ